MLQARLRLDRGLDRGLDDATARLALMLSERLALLLAVSLVGCAPWADVAGPPVLPDAAPASDAGSSDAGSLDAGSTDAGERDDICHDAPRACDGVEGAALCAGCFRGQCVVLPQQDHESCVADLDPLPSCGDEVERLGEGSDDADAPFLYGAGELWLPAEDGPDPIVACDGGYLWTLALYYLPTSAALEALVVVDEQGYTALLEGRGAMTTQEGAALPLHRGLATLCLPYDVTDAAREPRLRFGLQLIDEHGLRSTRSCGRMTTRIPLPGQRW